MCYRWQIVIKIVKKNQFFPNLRYFCNYRNVILENHVSVHEFFFFYTCYSPTRSAYIVLFIADHQLFEFQLLFGVQCCHFRGKHTNHDGRKFSRTQIEIFAQKTPAELKITQNLFNSHWITYHTFNHSLYTIPRLSICWMFGGNREQLYTTPIYFTYRCPNSSLSFSLEYEF